MCEYLAIGSPSPFFVFVCFMVYVLFPTGFSCLEKEFFSCTYFCLLSDFLTFDSAFMGYTTLIDWLGQRKIKKGFIESLF